MTAAPIVLFTFNRAESVKKSLSSLLQCTMAADSELLVFSDAPRNDSDIEKVNEVRKYLKALTGFKKVTVNERMANLGVDYNIINGLKEICEQYEKFIVIEDDLIFSENFLLFINQGLEHFQNYPSVVNISGFSYVSNIPDGYKYDSYFTRRSWTWGWGGWGSKMKNIDWEVKDFDTFINNPSEQNLLKKTGGSDLPKMLRDTMEGRMRTWDVRFFYYQFKHSLLTIYPVSSKTVNIGFTKEGSHTFGYNRYGTTLDSSNKQHFNFPDNTIVDERLNAAFLRRNNLSNRIITRVLSMMGVK